MITPKFSLNQTNSQVFVQIHIPSARLEDADIEFTESLLIFSCDPYYLRLHFPSRILPIDRISNTEFLECDFDKSVITVKLTKETQGEQFEGLENLLQLLNPSSATSLNNVVEVAGGTFNEEGEAIEEFLRQELPHDRPVETSEDIQNYGYGFAFRKHGELDRLRAELKDLFIFADKIEETSISDRSQLCCDLDNLDFNFNVFLSDTLDPSEELIESRNYQLPSFEGLTNADKEELAKIRNKELPVLDQYETRHVILGLLDILFAFVYDEKVTLGMGSAESSWTYTKLAPTFCALARYESVAEAFNSAIRRSLCYGLYRRFDFAYACVSEVVRIVEQGSLAILHCLLQMRKALAVETHYRYLINNLFIDDYCRFVQSIEDNDWSWLQIELQYVVKRIKFEDTGLKLDEHAFNMEMESLAVNDSALDSDDDPDP